MIVHVDISNLGFRFRGYPVGTVSEGVMAMLREPGRDAAREVARILREAKSSEPGIDQNLLWTSRVGTADVWLTLEEHFDGFVYGPGDRPGHGKWCIYLPSER